MTQVTVTILPEQEKNTNLIKKLICTELSKKNISSKISDFSLEKKSIDARHGKLKIHLKYSVFFEGENSISPEAALPQWKKADPDKTVIIIGSGPAGLFGALKLLEHGIKPLIIERGQETYERKRTIAQISTQHNVNADSNYCFGEGGAGTFSDGKLYTRSNKRGDISKILKIFNHFGTDQKILTDAHPHIGTDKLPAVINAMKEFIRSMGGETYFNTRCTDFLIDDGHITGVKTVNTITGEAKEFKAHYILLATGHSAADIYQLLAKTNPASLEAKTFAMGVRVEHPRKLIDSIQYHGRTEGMGAAEYRLTTQVDGHGVYSFCMCPGGFVVPSSSGPDEIVVNGMSAAGRNSQWSNSAIVTEIRPEDIPEEFISQAKAEGSPALAGLYFRTWLEKETKNQGNGQSAPAQILTDFLAHKETKTFQKTSYTPGLTPSRLDQWLPEQISSRLAQGFLNFDKNMKGFVTDEAVLIASETRTSTPVRILRNKETFESTSIKGLFPAGEGSGYAGGIVSSAMDGENACQKIAELFTNK